MIRRRQNPAGLGIVPVLLLTGGLISAGAATIAGWWNYDQIGKDMPGPRPLPAPAAPQTLDDMLNWNPDKLDTANVRLFNQWRATAADAGAAHIGPPATEDYTRYYLAAAAALALLWLSFKD